MCLLVGFGTRSGNFPRRTVPGVSGRGPAHSSVGPVKELRGHSDSVFAFVESWKNDKTDDSFHGFSLSAASVSLSISLLLVYAKNPNKIFTKHNKLRHG